MIRKVTAWAFRLVRTIYDWFLRSGLVPPDPDQAGGGGGGGDDATDVGMTSVDFREPIDDNRFGPPRREYIRLERDGVRLELTNQRGSEAESIEEVESDSASWVEVGEPGTRYATGLPVGHEQNEYFAPVQVRGQGGDIGRFRQLARSSPTYRRGLSTIVEGLVSVPWRNWDDQERGESAGRQDAAPDRVWEWRIEPSNESEEARKRAKVMERAIQSLHGGWRQFLQEWSTALVDGFAVWEPVFYGPGDEWHGLPRKLGFREQSTVERWLLDERLRELLGIQFATPDRRYTLGANELLIYSHRRTGMIWEGDPPLRSVARHIEAIQDLLQTRMISAEAYGVPWMFGTPDPEVAGQIDDTLQGQVEQQVTDAKASQRPFLNMPYGMNIDTTSPQSTQPEFATQVDQHREFVFNSLKAEGAMMGVNSVGALAAREAADKEQVRQIPYYARLIAGIFNAGPDLPHDGLLQMATDRRWGEPVGDDYMRLRLYVYPEDDDASGDLVKLARGGFIKTTPEVREEIHRRKGLPIPDDLSMGEVGAPGNGPSGGPPGGGRGPSPRASVDAAVWGNPYGGPSGPDLVEDFPGLEDRSESEREQWLAVFERTLDEDESNLDEAAAMAWAALEGSGEGSRYVRIRAQQNLDRARSGFQQSKNRARRALESIGRKHREWARERIQDVNSADDLAELEEAARNRFLGEYRDALRDAFEQSARQGAVDVGRDFGVTISEAGGAVSLAPDRRDEIEALARDRAKEMFDRQQGMINDNARQRLGTTPDGPRGVPKLSSSTVEDIGKRGSTVAYREGRNEVVERADDLLERDVGDIEIRAERINPIDDLTCSTCETWHGEQAVVGSDRYHRMTPPGRGQFRCEGDDRCRCLWTYIPPPELDTETFRRVLQEKLR